MKLRKATYLAVLLVLIVGLLPATLAAAPPAPQDNVEGESTAPGPSSPLIMTAQQPANAPAASPSPETILWDQPADGTGQGIVSDFYLNTNLGTYAADDFEIAVGTWNITTIFVDGFINLGDLATNAQDLNWYIYADSGGVPAGSPGDGLEIWSLTLAPNDPAVSITGSAPTLDVVTAQGGPISLSAGTYWLIFYPSINIVDPTEQDRWNWFRAGTANLSLAQLFDEGNFGGLPWTPIQNLVGEAWHDQAFRLEGTSGAPPHFLLAPATLETTGCAGEPQTHSLSLNNQLGITDTFSLSYEVLDGLGTLTGPLTLTVAHDAIEGFDVQLTPNECLYAGVEVVAQVHAEDSSGFYSDTAVITKTIISGGLDQWLPADDTPLGVAYHAVAYYDEALYQIGGGPTRWTPVDTVNRYDITTGSWVAVSPMITAAYGIDAAVIGDLIYVPGGSDDTTTGGGWLAGGTFLDSLQIYDPVADSWSTGAPMPARLTHASAVAYDGLLYVIGGLQEDGTATDSLYIYDPGADSWSVGASMAVTRSVAAAGAVDGKIYIAGGYYGANGGATTNNTMEIYDIATDSWSLGPGLLTPWAPYGDAVYQDRYFVIFNGGDITDSSFYCGQDAMWYDTVDGAWENLPGLNRCLYGAQGAATENRIYLVSGRTNEGGWHMAIEVDYLMECPACTDVGWLEGYVLDGETGNVDPVCTDAYLHFEPGDLYANVDPLTGYYQMELYAGTYSAEATAPGYSLETAAVDVTTGLTTSQDFGLQRPVIDVEPDGFDPVTAVVNEPTAYTLVISNLGHLPLDFEIQELPPGMTLLESGLPAPATTWLEGDLEVDPQVYTDLEAGGKADFFVQMRLQADLNPAYGIDDWADRGQYVYDSLQAATAAQAPVIALARERGLTYRSYLTSNSVLIKNGSLADLEAVTALSQVRRIEANRIYQLEESPQASNPEAWGWNLDALDPNSDLYGMQAIQVWQDLGVQGDCVGCGHAGEDHIIVAGMDTGVTYQHEALVRQYRGNNGDGTFSHDYNWYAPTITATTACPDAAIAPCDYHSHGSGITGIMVGETQDLVEQIGIAPHAQWIHCMGCDSPPSGCSREATMACADWMLAPTMVDGSNPDPDMRPHVVNNSWGGPGCDDWYQTSIEAWRAAGIFPAFSAGNTTACNAVGAPGDTPNAWGTAAHGQNGQNLYAGGPSCWFPEPSCDPNAHEVDPHVNAPSFGRTAGNAPGQYWLLSGTSGASPHTAGCVALMWSANPYLAGDIETTFTILEQSADRTSTQPWAEGTCGKPACAGTDTYPNFEYGWGYLDCYAAVEAALALKPEMEWVTVDPPAGTVPSQDTATIDVTFLCTETREYTGTLVILNNDPCQGMIEVPIALTCQEANFYLYLPIIIKD